MSTHFNNLSPAEAERLALLLEELGEAQQAIGKILRHGYESTHPEGCTTNREELEKELGDVRSAISMMTDAHDLDHSAINDHAFSKSARVKQYLHHQAS